MNEFTIGGLIVFFTAVLPCFICGYLIAVKGRRNLISGWDDSKFSNPESASKIIGLSLILMAALLALVTILWCTQLITEVVLIYFIVTISLVPILALIYVKNRFRVK